jgi:hypothetical protein
MKSSLEKNWKPFLCREWRGKEKKKKKRPSTEYGIRNKVCTMRVGKLFVTREEKGGILLGGGFL